MKTFVQYDDDGNILSIINEHEDFYQMRKDAGHQLLEVDNQFDIKTHKVNTKKKSLEFRKRNISKKIVNESGSLVDMPDFIEPPIDAKIHGLLKNHLSKKKLKGE